MVENNEINQLPENYCPLKKDVCKFAKMTNCWCILKSKASEFESLLEKIRYSRNTEGRR